MRFAARLASIERRLSSDDGAEAGEIPAELIRELADWPACKVRPESAGRHVIGRTWQAADLCQPDRIVEVQAECRTISDKIKRGELATYDQVLSALPTEAFNGQWHAEEIAFLQNETLTVTSYGRCGLIGIVNSFRGKGSALHIWPGSIAEWQAATPYRDRIAAFVDDVCPPGALVRIKFEPACELPRHHDHACGEFLLARVALPDGRDLGDQMRDALHRCN